jgi:hypothetical protein
MSQFRLPIINWSTRPDDVGDCYFEPYDILATNDLARRMILRMGRNNAAQPTVKSGVYGSFVVPRNYLTSVDPIFLVEWTSTVASGNVTFALDFAVVGAEGSGMDPSSWVRSDKLPNQNVGGANQRKTNSITHPAGLFAIGSIVNFYFTRDGTDSLDNKSGSALVFDLSFQYEGS